MRPGRHTETVLAELASTLATERPNEPIQDTDVSEIVHEVTEGTRRPLLPHIAKSAAPTVQPGETRGEYAHRLRNGGRS